MSYVSVLDAQGVHAWATRAVAELMQRREEINSLNVFPVPDSDTGSNMAHTMEAALAQAAKGGDVAEALAVGSVRGARGNSGMVLSQVLRAVSDSTQDSVVDGKVIADSLNLALHLVTRAISDPVEGTVVTVLRAAAGAAQEAVNSGEELHGVVSAAVNAARVSLRETPSQLPALREAGVVDAGGAGLVILLESLLAEVDGAEKPGEIPVFEDEHSSEIEVVFDFQAGTSSVDELEAQLQSMGDSLVVARLDDDEARFHIHSTVAGAVIEAAFAAGQVSGLRLEALPVDSAGIAPVSAQTVERTMFAAAPHGALAELFAASGAQIVGVDEPVTGSTPADIFIQNGSAGDPGEARVVATDSFVAGFAALSVYDQSNPDTDAVVSAMRDAARSMRVARPREGTKEAIVMECRDLLLHGGEQITIMGSTAVDGEHLGQQLGVDVLVVPVPDMATEIGVE